MNWTQAVDAMRAGATVRRKSEDYHHIRGEFYYTGEEACRLGDALTHDRQQVQVFQGANSRVLFVPGPRHMDATDWFVVT